MSNQPTSSIPPGRAQRAAGWIGVASLACGALALLGWQFNFPALEGLYTAWYPMPPLAAALFAFSGLSLYLHTRVARTPRTVQIARAAAALAMVLALTTLVLPDRIHVDTELEFILLSVGLLAIDLEWRHGFRPAQWLAWAAALLALLVVVDSVYGGDSLQALAPNASGLLHTPILLFLLAGGLLLARPDSGLVCALTSSRPSGTYARYMLPAVVLIPIVAGWLGLSGEQSGIYSNEFGDALFTLVEVALLSALMVWSSNRFLRLELEREQMLDDLAEREAGLRHAQALNKMAYAISDAAGTLLSWSETLPQLAALPAPPSSVRGWMEMVHPADYARLADAFREARRSQSRVDIEYRLLRRDGQWADLHQVTEPLPATSAQNETPPGPRWFSTIQDITEYNAQIERIARLSRISAVLSSINSAIVRIHDREELFNEACRVAVKDGAFSMAWIAVIDPDTLHGRAVACHGGPPGHIENISVSAAATHPHSGRPASLAVRQMRPVICNDIATEPSLTALQRDMLEHGHLSLAALPIIHGGKAEAVLVLCATEPDFFDEQEMKLLNELSGDLGFALDYIGKEERLHYLANYDALTGLANAHLFQDRLVQLLHGANVDAPITAVMLINLDHFAQINEAYGRHTGDALLCQIAHRLQAALPEACSVARIGGDTFAIAAPQLRHGAEAEAMLTQRAFARLELPFDLDPHDVRITLRAGIALAPADGADAETLFKHAEAALKNAKGTGSRYLYYAPGKNLALAARLALEHELRLALDARHFVLHYQPRVELQTGRIVSAEALIRWQHPARGLHGPREFVTLAEETGLIAAIGDWVIDEVCAQQAAWRRDGVATVPVAVNLSAVQFKGSALIDHIRAAVQRNGIAQHLIEFELTESMVMQDPEEAARNMAALKALGTNLSMDDFGTGYSSLAYLKRFPFDFLKIDRAFVTDVTSSPGDAAIAAAIVAMAHGLKLRVVAEGVENEGQLQFLRALRCDEIQGYYFSRPLSAPQLAAMLREDKRLPLPAPPHYAAAPA
jgi:diguanylate cyclase (GGDEF)-like protein